ncbi:TPM domain-containing protein [Patescibacteria group bacterium]|nr:TPM domain-containing protein [Patescibacteria group bacterium]MBU4057677.1 TPM domain-containing protein [Patescibacteria group bacterium]MBU4116074.1 TPM domain-containing protein [Patescibacteria group bacterium]
MNVNYKKLLIIALFLTILPITSFAFAVPEKPSSFVSDYADMLKPEEKAILENKLSEFEKQTTNEIGVVIIKSLEGDTIENIAQEIFTKWGIGKKDKNNGVLLLISLDDRQTRIHTGYGVEPFLTDIGTSYIQSDIITPAFKQGDYFGGIDKAIDKMLEALGGQEIIPEGYSEKSGGSKFNFNFIFVALIIFQWIIAVLARSKTWWAGGIFGGVVGLIISLLFISSLLLAISLVGFFVGFGLFLDFIVSRAYQKYKTGGGVPPWFLGGGGFGGSRGGGGFGGFGGGMSGGGGSSGRW